MKSKPCKLKRMLPPSKVGILLLAMSASLLGCEQQPQSLFEQHADRKSENNSVARVNEDNNAIDKTAAVFASPSSKTIDDDTGASTSRIQVIQQQAIAEQFNCDAAQETCQYFELNALAFSPEQPWLSSIMWQTIAGLLAPEMPLTSQDEANKKTVLMLFNQIEYGEQVVSSLPMYQRIDTELVINPLSSSMVADNERAVDSIATGYLAVRSKQQRSARSQQLAYVMLDMQKKIQLTVEDILLPDVSTDVLLLVFQTAKKEWLTLQGVEQQYHEDWPLYLSEQWYLNEQGLHMVYQAGELLTAKTEAVDLIVPYSLLKEVIKPQYIVRSSIKPKD